MDRKKIAFIGAGSFAFTRNVVRDLFTFPNFNNVHIELMDIDADRLERIYVAVEKIRKAMNMNEVLVTTTMDRTKALTDADGVLCTVFNGDIDIWRYDIEIPKKYGVDINIGDTRSVSGIFRALRNIPLMLDICHDIEKYCPKAVFLNYTNPMSMLCKAMQTYTKVDVTGLCHSVVNTVEILAKWLEIPYKDISYLCAGVNHQAFYLKLEKDGIDLYPMLREKIKDSTFYDKEVVRNEMFKYLDYYVTESSGHNSEYNQWFRKRPDLLEKYCSPRENSEWNPGEYAFSLNKRLKRRDHWREEIDEWINSPEIDLKKGTEYASDIFNARFGDGTPFEFNANVLNHGSISNLPYESCVEIPTLVTNDGYKHMIVGELPKHLAILVGTTARIEDLVVEACMEKNKRKVIQAVCMDPLSSAVCSLQEINDMCEELFEINKDFLGDYK